MKKFLLGIGIFAGIAATHITAQESEGVINYQVKINMHKTLPSDRQHMKDMLPEYRVSMDQLFFNDRESLYKPLEEEPEPEMEPERGPRVRLQRPRQEIYLNRIESQCIILQEFMGKKYLIEDTLKVRAWKITQEVREINGYPCRKATFADDERKMNVVAWYCDRFRPFLGPEQFNTLPGAVLLVDINDGERVITATDIQFRPLKKNELSVPNAKTKVTEEEYRKIVREQAERMRANGRNVIIRN